MQSSVALLEKQRNPGVGYWTTRTSESGNPVESGTSTPTTSTPRTNSPAPGSSGHHSEEEVNLEYLRNIILQFLEHKEMRVSQSTRVGYLLYWLKNLCLAKPRPSLIHHSTLHTSGDTPPNVQGLTIFLSLYTYVLENIPKHNCLFRIYN